MPRMIRKQVYIEKWQDMMLKQKAQEFGIKEAEIIRKGIERILDYPSSPTFDLELWEREKNFIHQLMAKGRVKNIPRWKRDELYERFCNQ